MQTSEPVQTPYEQTKTRCVLLSTAALMEGINKVRDKSSGLSVVEAPSAAVLPGAAVTAETSVVRSTLLLAFPPGAITTAAEASDAMARPYPTRHVGLQTSPLLCPVHSRVAPCARVGLLLQGLAKKKSDER